MEVKNGFKGIERRKNGKVNLSLRDWIWISLIILSFLGACTKFYFNTIALAEQCEANTQTDKIQNITNKKQDEAIIEIKSDLNHIVDKVEMIDCRQQEQIKLLNKILGKLES